MKRQRRTVLVFSTFLLGLSGCSGQVGLGTLFSDGGSPDPGSGSVFYGGDGGDTVWDSGPGDSGDVYYGDGGGSYFDDSGVTIYEDGGTYVDDAGYGGSTPWDDGGDYDDGGSPPPPSGGDGGTICSQFGPSCTCTENTEGHQFAFVCEADSTCDCYVDGTLVSSVKSNLSCTLNTDEILSFCGFPTF